MKIEITHSLIENIFNFIKRSSYELENSNYFQEEIKVMMPNYLKRNLQEYYNNTMTSCTEDSTLFGLEILPHYKDEVVVFYENYFKTTNHFKILNLEL